MWLVMMLVMAFSVLFRITGLGGYFRSENNDFQIEVLNGTGVKNLAGSTTRQLRIMGIDVLIEGNAEAFDFRESIVIDRKGDLALAEGLARRIGCSKVIQQVQKRPKVDITFILGDDYKKLSLGD
jgi:hypothetical protein